MKTPTKDKSEQPDVIEAFSNQNPQKIHFTRFKDTRHLILHPLGFCTGNALRNYTIDKVGFFFMKLIIFCCTGGKIWGKGAEMLTGVVPGNHELNPNCLVSEGF